MFSLPCTTEVGGKSEPVFWNMPMGRTLSVKQLAANCYLKATDKVSVISSPRKAD